MNLDKKVDSEHSSYIEKLIEHLFISDILETAWQHDHLQIEIARAEIDNSGYDLILECNGIIRHVQLKCSDHTSTTTVQKVNIKLAQKPAGCIIWIVRTSAADTLKINLKYSFFGTSAGGKMCDLSRFKTATHSKGNAQGIKAERPNIKVIPKREFKKLPNTASLLNELFNLSI